MKHVIGAIIVGLAVGGCSVSAGVNTGVGVRTVVRDVDDDRRVMFIELVKTIQFDWNRSRSRQHHERIEHLVYSSGLHNTCNRDQCYLVNPANNAHVRINPDHVYIEFGRSQYYKIQDPSAAAYIVYQ